MPGAVQPVSTLRRQELVVVDQPACDLPGRLGCEVGFRPGEAIDLHEVVAQLDQRLLVIRPPQQLLQPTGLGQAVPDEAVDERRPGLQRELRLVGLEHEREVHPEAVFTQLEREPVAGEAFLRRCRVPAPVEPLRTGEQLAVVRRRHRSGVRHLDHDPPFPEDVAQRLALVEDLAEIRFERVVQLDGDVTTGAEDAPDLGHHLLSGGEEVIDVGVRIVDEQVVDDARVAGEVGDQRRDRLQLVGIGRVGGEQHRRRPGHAVGILADVANQVGGQDTVTDVQPHHAEPCRQVTRGNLEVANDPDEFVGDADVSCPARRLDERVAGEWEPGEPGDVILLIADGREAE